MRSFRTIGIMLLTGLLLSTGATSALADGTNAGDTVSNQATLDYEVGGVNQPDVLSDGDGIPGNGNQPTTFLVDNRVDLTMAASSNNASSGTGQILVFTVTNTGNEDQGYALQLFTGANGSDDDINFNNVAIYFDADKSGTLTVGDTAYTSGSGVRVGAVDVPANAGVNSTIQILVIGDVPAGATTGQTADYTLKAFTLNAGTDTETTATAGANTAGIDVVLADITAAAGGVGGAADATNDGDYYATATYTVQAALLSVTKSVAVISDPINGAANPKAIPGATVRYSIVITNNGVAAATLLALTDPIPSNTWFVAGSVSAVGASAVTYDANNAGTWSGVPANGADGTDHSITDIKVEYATLAGSGGSYTLTFDVKIQ